MKHRDTEIKLIHNKQTDCFLIVILDPCQRYK